AAPPGQEDPQHHQGAPAPLGCNVERFANVQRQLAGHGQAIAEQAEGLRVEEVVDQPDQRPGHPGNQQQLQHREDQGAAVGAQLRENSLAGFEGDFPEGHQLSPSAGRRWMTSPAATTSSPPPSTSTTSAPVPATSRATPWVVVPSGRWTTTFVPRVTTACRERGSTLGRAPPS